ncbi:T9SS C-terminal target domain-containing protein [Chryseobacterium nematophagum]|uniref:T9SS C-terminal target domain-containing protein n=1 Tax=Chryseobacterium nematophagum TaxID=2305228 RepID=A0A3M7TEN4_9FLAO|nr:T9SS type A sorting domain-containing protein [Chryseobacterium nematophagum]RNA61436.1 T9SS C-terminal target domain-containing protein [Chryseobacterium nematophagum]
MKTEKKIMCIFILLINFCNTLKSQTIDKQFFLVNTLADLENTTVLDPIAYNSEYIFNAFIPDIVTPCSINRDVYFVARNAGLRFNAGPGSLYDDYSVSIYFKFNPYEPIVRNYVRILDVKDNTVDAGIYRTGNNLNFYPNGNVGTDLLINSGTEYVLLTLTRNGPTGLVKVYINGLLASTYNDSGGVYTVAPSGNFIFIKDDIVAPLEQSPTNIAYIRVSNTVLSDQNILDMYDNICENILGNDEINSLDNEVRIYPNPVKDVLKFKLDNFLYSESINIYDVNGRVMTSIGNSKNVNEINLLGYPSGNYILKIKASNGKTYVRKISKK